MDAIKDIEPGQRIDELKGFIDRFKESTLLVVGDFILDEYIWGEVSRISPEAPVPVVEVSRETEMLGGAANVICNIVSLGGNAMPCGVLGDDSAGRKVGAKLLEIGCASDGIVLEPGRHTSVKTRIVAHQQQVVRFDRESREEIAWESVKALLGCVERRLHEVQGVIVADYGKGVVSGKIMRGLMDLVKEAGVMIAVDPKVENFDHYKGVDVITPNHHEAGAFCRIRIDNERALVRAGRQMLQELDCRAVLITQGPDGMTLFERTGEISHIPTAARKVFDVTGAGDTVIGTLCLGLASGMDLKSSAVLSNFAAGIVVGEVGTSVVKGEELKRVLTGARVKGP